MINKQLKRRRLQTAPLAGALAIALGGLAGCDDQGPEEGGSAQNSEAIQSAGARQQADVEAIRAVGSCFTNGIDTLTKDVPAGTAIWETCFTDDHTFAFTGEIPGTGAVATMTCPGDNCGAPSPQVGAGPRAAFASGIFRQSGYVGTQHILSNVVVAIDGNKATLDADLVAYHFKADKSTDIFNGRWSSDMVKVKGRWLSSHERAVEKNFVTLSGAPLGTASRRHNEAVGRLANCYTTGIDQLGAGETAAGKATWASCYTDDFSWDFNFGPVGSVDCPGEACPLPAPGTGSGPRADFAAGHFAQVGYTGTQHLLTNLAVDVNLAESSATIAAVLTAFHYLPDGKIDLFSGPIVLSATLGEDQIWRVSHESGDFTGFSRMTSEPVPAPGS